MEIFCSSVKFHAKISTHCWNINKSRRGDTFLCSPCIFMVRVMVMESVSLSRWSSCSCESVVGCNVTTMWVCYVYRYLAVHSFGRRMLYPGSTSLVQALMGQFHYCDWYTSAGSLCIVCQLLPVAGFCSRKTLSNKLYLVRCHFCLYTLSCHQVALFDHCRCVWHWQTDTYTVQSVSDWLAVCGYC